MMRGCLMKSAATLALTLTLAACGQDKAVYTDGDGNAVKISRDGDGETSQVQIETADGSATVNMGGEHSDAKLPFGLAVYPGATVVSSINSNADGKQGAMVVMESSAKRDTVIAWYRKAAEAKGFKIETEFTTQDVKAIAGTREGGSFSLQVTPAESGSSITLIAGQN